MTLRSRFTLLVTGLLTVVLVAAAVVLERLDAQDMERRIELRAREHARPQPLGPPEPGRNRDDGPTATPLPAEPDGSHVEVFVFETTAASAGQAAPLAPRLRRSTGRERIRLATAHEQAQKAGVTRRVEPGSRPPQAPVQVLEVDGVEWAVATDVWMGPPGPRGPPGADRPGPRLHVATAFFDRGPERARHVAFMLRVGLVALGASLLGGLLALLFARRMLRPVARAAAAAERVTSPRERLPVGTSDDELARLLAVLNGMLARLEAASEREREFLASASHELRRPLAALLGELELATAPGRDPLALRAAIGLAIGDARGMRRLIDDLLDHARAQAGRLRLEPQDTDLVEIVAGGVESSRRSLGGELSVEVGDVPPLLLRVDPDAMRRVVENLVVNAARHGGDGVHVAVRVETRGGRVRLHVEDDGPGIPADELPRLFDAFARGDRARTVPGLGLGLAISKAIVEGHGGTISATSPIASDARRPGTRFTVDLPAERVVESPTAPA